MNSKRLGFEFTHNYGDIIDHDVVYDALQDLRRYRTGCFWLPSANTSRRGRPKLSQSSEQGEAENRSADGEQQPSQNEPRYMDVALDRLAGGVQAQHCDVLRRAAEEPSVYLHLLAHQVRDLRDGEKEVAENGEPALVTQVHQAGLVLEHQVFREPISGLSAPYEFAVERDVLSAEGDAYGSAMRLKTVSSSGSPRGYL